MVDNGHKTDILISDGPNYYRIQIKTVEAMGEDHTVRYLWGENSYVDIVVILARNSNWGYVLKAFDEPGRALNHNDHRRFQQGKNEFLKEFHKIENR
jgi:hypothetical protein